VTEDGAVQAMRQHAAVHRALVPIAFRSGLYRLRRGHLQVDDFFAVFVGSIWR
jgi:hypothetical protein